MAEKKMTRKEALEIAIAAVDGEAREVLTKMYEQVTKPRKKAEGPSKTRLANEKLAAECVAAIEAHGEPVTGKWLVEHVNGLLTPQKCTAVIRIAIENGEVVKTKEGKNTYYALA